MNGRMKYVRTGVPIPYRQDFNTSTWEQHVQSTSFHTRHKHEPSASELLKVKNADHCLVRLKHDGELLWISEANFLGIINPRTAPKHFNLIKWIAPTGAEFRKLQDDWTRWLTKGGQKIRIWLTLPHPIGRKIPLQIEKINLEPGLNGHGDIHLIHLQLLQAEWEKRTRNRERISKANQKLKDLQEDFSTWLHDWKVPLSTIESSAWLCQRYQLDTDKEKRERHLIRIEKAVQEMKVEMQDWSTWHQLPSVHHFESISISDFIKARIEQIYPILKTGQTIHFWHQGKTEFNSDPQALHHVLDNLLSNASKFSPESSSINLKCWNNGDQVRIEIRDEGIGIKKEELVHLFSARYRASNADGIPGNGIGLSIVERLVKQLGGHIEVCSELNQGTTFSITIKNQPIHEKSIDH